MKKIPVSLKVGVCGIICKKKDGNAARRSKIKLKSVAYSTNISNCTTYAQVYNEMQSFQSLFEFLSYVKLELTVCITISFFFPISLTVLKIRNFTCPSNNQNFHPEILKLMCVEQNELTLTPTTCK